MNKGKETIKKTPSPAEFLEQAFGRQVLVKLTNNTEIKGNILYIIYKHKYFIKKEYY
jgi:hypothetical protein